MRKTLLFIGFLGMTLMAQSQVIFAVQSPASISGNYGFTWAPPTGGWGTPDFLIAGTYVEDTLMMVDDSSAGTNPQGNPVAQEGCNPLVNDLTGKIAVIYRNTCEFGTKAMNAQNAGAVACIIINREPGLVNMGAGAEGANVTIPTTFVEDATGATIVAEMANGPVVVLIGNKTGLFGDDAGLTPSTTLIPRRAGQPALLSQSATEFNFELGARIYNYGIGDQTNASLNAVVTDPSNTSVYDETASGLTILSGDSIDVYPALGNTLPAFSLATYSPGTYTLTYTVALDTTDEYVGDNTLSTTFTINDSVWSYAQIDTTGMPQAQNFYRPSTNNQTYSICTVLDDANADRLGAAGLYFSASTSAASMVPLTGEEMALYLYKWDDSFVDLTTAPTYDMLTPVADGFYYYPADLQNEAVYAPFNTAVALESNQRYLACVQTVNTDLYLGFDGTDYEWNVNFYLQPQTPIENDGSYFWAGFGTDLTAGIGIKVFDVANIGLDETAYIPGMAYPNPTTDMVSVSLNAEGNATLVVTDITGKVVLSEAIVLNNGKSNIDLSTIESGIYVFNILTESGKKSQFNVVKD